MSRDSRKDSMNRIFTNAHRALFKATKGRIGGKGFGMPVLILTTTGRKSGEPRETMLTAPLQPDDSVVLVASNGGDHRAPQWFRNLEVKPEVHVVMGGRSRDMVARVASEDEKAELWPQVVDAYKGYANYQTKTDRNIPLVVLDPVS